MIITGKVKDVGIERYWKYLQSDLVFSMSL